MNRIERLGCSLALMPFGNFRWAVPKGLVTIAQRFNAGRADEYSRVPKGRPNSRTRLLPFSRPCGTYILGTTFPALKRRVIVGSPYGTRLQPTCI
jgi:hypothetical protein